MKKYSFLADENIPLLIVSRLQKDGIDIVSQSMITPGADDEQLLLTALNEERVIVTFDKDFGELIFKEKRRSYGVILLRLHPLSSTYVFDILKKVLQLEGQFAYAFCVVESDRIRRRPLS